MDRSVKIVCNSVQVKKCLIVRGKIWYWTFFCNYVYSYNTTPLSVTGKSRMELLTGRPVKDPLPSLRTDTYWKRDEETKDKDAIMTDAKIASENEITRSPISKESLPPKCPRRIVKMLARYNE